MFALFVGGKLGSPKSPHVGGRFRRALTVSGNKKLAHNLGTWPKGQTKSFQFNGLGAAPLLCNVHAEMSGYVVVVATPYFAVTNKEGDFEVKKVPDGKHTLKTWSEDGKPSSQDVNVSGGTTNVELTVKKQSTSGGRE